jgi:hypothetical protein
MYCSLSRSGTSSMPAMIASGNGNAKSRVRSARPRGAIVSTSACA